MNIKNEIKVLCDTLRITETELGKELGVTFETINHWKNGRKNIDNSNLEKLHSFAYSKGIKFNTIYEQIAMEIMLFYFMEQKRHFQCLLIL